MTSHVWIRTIEVNTLWHQDTEFRARLHLSLSQWLMLGSWLQRCRCHHWKTLESMINIPRVDRMECERMAGPDSHTVGDTVRRKWPPRRAQCPGAVGLIAPKRKRQRVSAIARQRTWESWRNPGAKVHSNQDSVLPNSSVSSEGKLRRCIRAV